MAASRTAMLLALAAAFVATPALADRSEEHTSELQSLMRISYAVFCLKKKKHKQKKIIEDCHKLTHLTKSRRTIQNKNNKHTRLKTNHKHQAAINKQNDII